MDYFYICLKLIHYFKNIADILIDLKVGKVFFFYFFNDYLGQSSVKFLIDFIIV